MCVCVRCLPQLLLHLVFWDGVSHCKLAKTGWPVSSCLHLPRAGVTGVTMLSVMICTQVLMLAQGAVHNWADSPSLIHSMAFIKMIRLQGFSHGKGKVTQNPCIILLAWILDITLALGCRTHLFSFWGSKCQRLCGGGSPGNAETWLAANAELSALWVF